MAGTIVEYQCGRYLLRPRSKATLFPDWKHDDRKLPVLLFSSAHNDVTEETIVQKIKDFEAQDDVYSKDFLSQVVIVQTKPSSRLGDTRSVRPDKLQDLVPWQVQTVLSLSPLADGSLLPSGPYFLYRGEIFEAWKLYPDELSTFRTTVVPDLDDPYKYVAIRGS